MLAATNFSSLQRRFASDQTRKAYTALNEQFDAYTGVIWQPYTEAAIQARYPGGMSMHKGPRLLDDVGDMHIPVEVT